MTREEKQQIKAKEKEQIDFFEAEQESLLYF